MMITIALTIIVFMVLAMIATPRIVKAMHERMKRAAMSGEILSKPLKLLFLFDFAWLSGDNLYCESKYGRLVFDLNELQEVRYNFRIVPDNIGVLELVPRYGQHTSIDVSIPGMIEVISGLENRLPKLTRTRMTKCVKPGDVEGTCVVWKAS